jgi:hypothetical protein
MVSVKKQHLEHLIRAASAITGDHQLFVIGSQSILAKYPDAPAELLMSVEADLIAKNKTDKTDQLNSIGEDSPFHEAYGYYADPVGENTAILPKGWKGRLVNLDTLSIEGATVTGLCLDPHDLVLSKYAANREKDIEFNRVVIESNFVNKERLELLLKDMPISANEKHRIWVKIGCCFDAAHKKSRQFKPK